MSRTGKRVRQRLMRKHREDRRWTVGPWVNLWPCQVRALESLLMPLPVVAQPNYWQNDNTIAGMTMREIKIPTTIPLRTDCI